MPTAPLDIKVIYSATGKRAPKSVRPARTVRPGGGGTALSMFVGLLCIAAAAGLGWFVPWKVDRELYMVVMLKTPAIQLSEANTNLFRALPGAASNGSNGRRVGIEGIVPRGEDAPIIVGRTAQIVIGVTRYAWPVLAVLTASVLALAGGLAWGRALGGAIRTVALVLLLLGLAYAAWRVYGVAMEFGRHFKPAHVREGMSTVVVLAGLLGLWSGRGARGWSRFAGILLVVLGVASAAGIYLGRLCNAIPTAYERLAGPLGIVAIFGVCTAYGILLFLIAGRLRKRAI
ncbi:MAG: hypothetical protein J5J06_09910 [Phycisphaerae bacterium]|nr:hypothetical protein [Phycisphaerae bacterium]